MKVIKEYFKTVLFGFTVVILFMVIGIGLEEILKRILI